MYDVNGENYFLLDNSDRRRHLKSCLKWGIDLMREDIVLATD